VNKLITIQLLLPNEFERFKTIRLRALREDPDAFGATYQEACERKQEAWVEQVAQIPTFVATNGALDLGLVRVTKDAADPQIAWLISMWVAPEARGNQIASKLIDVAVEWSAKQGVRILRLDVGDFNTPAIALYERKGFKKNGVCGTLPEPRAHIKEHQRELLIVSKPKQGD
jgi:ribosomal protein S18 acetylase RimI-like enzyme